MCAVRKQSKVTRRGGTYGVIGILALWRAPRLLEPPGLAEAGDLELPSEGLALLLSSNLRNCSLFIVARNGEGRPLWSGGKIYKS